MILNINILPETYSIFEFSHTISQSNILELLKKNIK